MKKKLISALMIIALIPSFNIFSLDAMALEYGSEWVGSREPEQVILPPDKDPQFNDVDENHWAFTYIQTCSANDWVDGYNDGTFKPEKNITRAEALRVIVSFVNLPIISVADPTYSDVDKSDWYYDYVETGKELLPKSASGRFHPDTAITREDAVYMVVNVMGYDRYLDKVSYAKLNQYTDRSTISAETEPYMAVAVEYGIISGYDDGTIKPQGTLSRAEFAAVLCRTKKLTLK